VQALAEIAEPPELADVEALAVVVEGMQVCEVKIEYARSALGAMEKLEAAPAIEDVGPLARLIRQIQEQEREREAHAAAQKVLEGMMELAPVLDAGPLKNLIGELTAANDSVTRCSVEVRLCAEAVAGCAGEIREYLAENPSCPVCGGSIDPESLFDQEDQEHAHA
jgi:hypothetical protein